MARIDAARIVGEAAALVPAAGASELGVLSVAIFLEDALGVTLPEDALTVGALGSASAIARTVDAALQGP